MTVRRLSLQTEQEYADNAQSGGRNGRHYNIIKHRIVITKVTSVGPELRSGERRKPTEVIAVRRLSLHMDKSCPNLYHARNNHDGMQGVNVSTGRKL